MTELTVNNCHYPHILWKRRFHISQLRRSERKLTAAVYKESYEWHLLRSWAPPARYRRDPMESLRYLRDRDFDRDADRAFNKNSRKGRYA